MERKVVELISIIKFSIVGVSNTVLNFVSFILLNNMGVNYMVASITAYSLSIVNSYFWNSRLVFKCDNENKKSVVIKFVVLNLIGLSINTLLMAVLVGVLGIKKIVSMFIVTLLVMCINYILNKIWVFKKEIKIRKN